MFLHEGIALNKAIERIGVQPFTIRCQFLNLEFILLLIQLANCCYFKKSTFRWFYQAYLFCSSFGENI